MKKIVFLPVLLIYLFWAAPNNSFASDEVDAIWRYKGLTDLIHEGLQQNKNIQSLLAQAESLRNEISFAGSLDDPRLGIGLLNLPTDTFSFDQEPMTQKQLSIAQKFPWFGKLDLKEQKATLKAERQSIIVFSKQLELAKNIASIYFDLAFVEKSLEVNEKLTQKVRQISKAVEIGYSAGRGLQQDVLLSQVELTRLLNDKIDLTQQKKNLEFRLHELLNREKDRPLTLPRSYDLPNVAFDVDALRQMTQKQNPDLRIKLIEIDLAKLDTELAQKNYWPDMDVKLSYGQREENQAGQDLADFASATVTMNIPLWQHSRQDSQLAAAKSKQSAALKSFRNLYETLPHRVSSLTSEISTNIENYNLFKKGLLLQAEQTAQASMTAYEVGKVEFNTMITSQIRLLEFELKAQKYLFQAYKKWAALAELAGSPIEMKPTPDVSNKL